MTDDAESREEGIVLKRKLLRRNLKIGSWNVHTLRQAGKLEEMCDEASRYKLDLVGVQEVRERPIRSVIWGRVTKATLPRSPVDS